MGLHYSERQYYDDPIKNAEFIRVYGATLYCSHGQPSYAICYRCKEDNEFIKMRQYWDRLNIKYRNFNWNYFFGMESPSDDDGINVDDDYRVLGLKKTSSQEDLKKAFHQKARETHPDKIGGDGELFKKIKNAYENIKEQVGFQGRGGVQVV